MQFRDRIKELRRVPAERITGAPWNWRTHPVAQVDSLAASIEELGFFIPLNTRELPSGELELIDGHGRLELIDARIGPKTLIPCVVTDLNEAEAKKANALADPLAHLAGTDGAKLDALLAEVTDLPPAVESWLHAQADGARAAELLGTLGEGGSGERRLTNDPATVVKVVIPCTDAALFERAMAATGEANRATSLRLICESYLAQTRQQNV